MTQRFSETIVSRECFRESCRQPYRRSAPTLSWRDAMFQSMMPVTSATEVRQVLGTPFPNQVNKVIDHIDLLCRDWIEQTIFTVISSIGASGAMDVSPKGDPPGFVKILRQTYAGDTRSTGKPPRRHTSQCAGKPERWHPFHRSQAPRSGRRERNRYTRKRHQCPRRNDGQWKSPGYCHHRARPGGIFSLRESNNPVGPLGAGALGINRWSSDLRPGIERSRSLSRYGRNHTGSYRSKRRAPLLDGSVSYIVLTGRLQRCLVPAKARGPFFGASFW